uniref:F-box domain-containing protein n=1 Tax=Setaria viridis TaxID=4556 RepID=A0A4U6V7W5_SETVI|nr:hypothetical protein SEVIR_3G108166v2 [Setaria viridis]
MLDETPAKKPRLCSAGDTSCGDAAAAAAPVDRLSALPDAMLHHVMSFLRAWEVARTCVLSRRWRHLWASASGASAATAGPPRGSPSSFTASCSSVRSPRLWTRASCSRAPLVETRTGGSRAPLVTETGWITPVMMLICGSMPPSSAKPASSSLLGIQRKKTALNSSASVLHPAT